MRNRRAERLLLRAETAVDAGRIDEARIALEEARTVTPYAEAVAAMQQRIDAAEAREAALDVERRCSRRTRVRRVAVVVVVGGLVAASAAGGTWLARIQRATLPPVVMNGADTVLPAPSLRVETEPVDQRHISIFETPLAVSKSDSGTDGSAYSGHDAEPQPFVPPAPQLVPAEAPSETLPVISSPASDEPLAAKDPAPAPVATVGSLPAPPVVSSAPRAPAPPPVNDEALVHGVLDKYASAYSRLDANAASAAWPGVNRSALARAFDGLASQQVSLGSCDVSVKGAIARAACHGTATWRPKIGGGRHVDARTWTFDLAKAPGGWQIVDARVQNR